MLWLGLPPRRRAARRPLRLLVPVAWLAIAVVFLVGFRITLNVMDSNVIDVGYAGVIGADQIADGRQLYGNFPSDNEHGDTYGPVNYLAYVPFEQVARLERAGTTLPRHGAAIVFDLACVLLLFLLGRRRGADLGIALAYAWAAFPFTLYATNSNVNDALSRARAARAAVRGRAGAARRAARARRADEVRAARLAPLFATTRARGRRAARSAFGFAVGRGRGRAGLPATALAHV